METYIVASEGEGICSRHKKLSAAEKSLQERRRYAASKGGWTPFEIYRVSCNLADSFELKTLEAFRRRFVIEKIN